MKELNEIKSHIKHGIVKPVYILDGEETYNIDLITACFENELLNASEKDFNFKILYGKETNCNEILNECRSFPVFAQRRVVIVKEAALLKDLEQLESYIKNAPDTTVLLIAHKYKKIDGRKSFGKYIKSKEAQNKVGYFTFDKIKDYQLADWIMQYGKEHKIKLSIANAELLAAYLGNDLQKISNEIAKVKINMKPDEELSAELIEKYIGISKDYNLFQYPKSILDKNSALAFRIVNYYIANPKEAPLVMVTATLYNEFLKLYKYHYSKNLPSGDIAKNMEIAPFFLKDYQRAAQNYNLRQTCKAIQIIHDYNLNALGMHIANNQITILKEITYKLLNIDAL